MSYESQRAQLEAQIRKQKEAAQASYESDKKAAVMAPPPDHHTSMNSVYEEMYMDAMKQRTDVDSFVKEYEASRQVILEHNKRIENRCKDVLQTLETTIWRKLRWQTASGEVAYWDTETNHIWVINTNKIQDGGYKPQTVAQMNEIIDAGGLQSNRSLFNHESQPNGYMFEIN